MRHGKQSGFGVLLRLGPMWLGEGASFFTVGLLLSLLVLWLEVVNVALIVDDK